MGIRVGISGMGRTGRLVLRRLAEMPDEFEVVGIRALEDAATLVHLFKYDSVYGPYLGEVDWENGSLVVDGKSIELWGGRDTRSLRWDDLAVEVVIETSGVLVNRETDSHLGYDSHLTAGARKVVLTALTRDTADPVCIMGVNDHELRPDHACVSAGTASINSLAPVAKVLNDKFGIVKGFVTSLHQYATDQVLLDSPHHDPYFARSAVQNVITRPQPGVQVVGRIIPELMGRLHGIDIRVPVSAAGMIDLTVETHRTVTSDDANAVLKEAAEGPLRGVLDYTEDPIVSSDVRGDPHSAIVAGPLTQVLDNKLAKVVAWYDYEWAYCCRCVDVARQVGLL